MYRRPLITLIACATLMASLILVSPAVAAQPEKGKPPPPAPTVYDPYPPAILPDDLESEIARVRREASSMKPSESFAHYNLRL